MCNVYVSAFPYIALAYFPLCSCLHPQCRYANRAKNIKNQPRINEDPKDALLREYQEEITRLKSHLVDRKSSKGARGRRRHKGSITGEGATLGDWAVIN